MQDSEGHDSVRRPSDDLSVANIDIDRSSPVPLYHQVASQLESLITSGSLPQGHKFDNEMSLADRLGLSRPTMRRAMEELVSKGLLVRRRGVGTQVVNDQVRRDLRLTSLYDDLAAVNKHPATRVLVNEIVDAPSDIAEQLGLEAESRVHQLKRLRYIDDEPLALLRNWLPTGIVEFSTADLEDNGLYHTLRQSSIRLRMAHQKIGARAADDETAELLGIAPGAPLLTMRRIAFDDNGRAVEVGDHDYLPDRYGFETTLIEK